MAGRTLNRHDLREQAEHAERLEAAAASGEGMASETPLVKAKKAPAKPRKPRAKKALPRPRACWGVFDSSMKRVALFDYNQRPAADEKLAEMLALKKGLYFIQIVKDVMAEPGAAIAAE